MEVVADNPRRLGRLIATLAVLWLAWPVAALADKDPIYTTLFSDTALKGYDAVAYFTASEPTKGQASLSYEWQGVEWLFASEANRQRFIADPEAYAPQYGGYCAWAVSQGYTASGDPLVWRIVDGKLYLNYSRKVATTWLQSPREFIVKADANWPSVLKQ